MLAATNLKMFKYRPNGNLKILSLILNRQSGSKISSKVNVLCHNKRDKKSKFDFTNVKQSKMMKKIFLINMNKTVNVSPDPRDTIAVSKVDVSTNEKSHGRKRVLEAIFMDHVSNIIANEELGDLFSKYSIAITNLKINKDYQEINIWWHTENIKCLNTIAKSLGEYAGKIRAILTSQNVVGKIPHIKFVLDKQLSNTTMLESVLSTADFGPDYDPRMGKKSFPQMHSESLESQINVAFETMKKATEEVKKWRDKLNVPKEMKQDILGLDHSKVMEEVLQKKTKHCLAQRRIDENFLTDETHSNTVPSTNNTIDTLNFSHAGSTLKEFLNTRKKSQKKESRKTIREKEFLEIAVQEAYDRYNQVSYKTDNFEDHEEEFDYDDFKEKHNK